MGIWEGMGEAHCKFGGSEDTNLADRGGGFM